MWPLATKELCGVGRHTEEKLERINIRTIGELATRYDAIAARDPEIVFPAISKPSSPTGIMQRYGI